MKNRRKFIKQSALAGLGISTIPSKPIMNVLSDRSRETKSNLQMTLATVSWTFGLDDLDELFSKVSEAGFDALQFCGDFQKYKAEDVLAKSQKYGVLLASYDPLECKPDSKEEATLENSVAFYKKVIDYAVELQVPMTTLQGLSFWTKNTDSYEVAMQQIIKAVRQLDQYADGKSIILSYEACCHYETPQVHTAVELLRIKNESEAKNLKLVLDSFHMNIDEKDMITPIEDVGADLLYSYHVSDSGRGGIGSGHIDFRKQFETLEKIGFNDLVCFEIVLPEVRPYKLPMTDAQMQQFLKVSKESLAIWKNMMDS